MGSRRHQEVVLELQEGEVRIEGSQIKIFLRKKIPKIPKIVIPQEGQLGVLDLLEALL